MVQEVKIGGLTEKVEQKKTVPTVLTYMTH